MLDLQVLLTLIFIILVASAIAVLFAHRGPKRGSTGTTLGPYRNLTLLSDKGGMSKLYRAHNSERNRDCVLKVLRTEFLGDRDIKRKFEREAEILLSIKNSYRNASIVQVYTHGTISSGVSHLPFIEMRYIPGKIDLGDLIKQRGRLSEEESETIIFQIVRALKAAHEENTIHRDIKPQNILLYDGRIDGVVVCDFGVAKKLDAKSMTTAGFGTAAYMSPEQCLSDGKISTKTDVYSLGVIWYEMLAGKRLFEDDNPLLVMDHHRDKDPLSLIEENVPAKFQKMIYQMLQKQPAKRPSLEKILMGISAKALNMRSRVPTDEALSAQRTADHLARWRSIRRLTWAVGGLLIAVLGLIAFRAFSTAGARTPLGGSILNGSAAIVVENGNQQKPALNLAQVEIITDPIGAEVLIGERNYGKTPVRVGNLSVGSHKIRLRSPDNRLYLDEELRVNILPNSFIVKKIKFTRGKGEIFVNSSPWGEVYLDGVLIGTTPTTKTVDAGNREVEIRRDGYQTVKRNIKLMTNDKQRISAKLTQ